MCSLWATIQGLTTYSSETRCLALRAQIKALLTHYNTAAITVTPPAYLAEGHDDRIGGFKKQHFSISL